MTGGLYQAGGEFVGIEYLTIVENALHGRQGGADKKSICLLCSDTVCSNCINFSFFFHSRF